jgi:hypothetical protein
VTRTIWEAEEAGDSSGLWELGNRAPLFSSLNRESRVVDRDPDGSALILGCWIRIQEGKNHKYRKNLRIFMF